MYNTTSKSGFYQEKEIEIMSRYNEFKEMGLTDERYFQMMKSFKNNEEFIEEAIEDWGD